MTSPLGFPILLVAGLLLLGACGPSTGEPTAPDTELPLPPAADHPNVDEESIYEVDAEDPYKIFNGTFFDLAPGLPLAPALDRLRRGELRNGEGSFEVYYIDGRDGEELGYVMADPVDALVIGDITVTSERVITEQGMRVGNSYEELTQRLGVLEVSTSEVEGRRYATDGKLRYRLVGKEVTEIVIDR